MSRATECDICGCFIHGDPTTRVVYKEWNHKFNFWESREFDLCIVCKHQIEKVLHGNKE